MPVLSMPNELLALAGGKCAQ